VKGTAELFGQLWFLKTDPRWISSRSTPRAVA
jgi:hypothetical protein